MTEAKKLKPLAEHVLVGEIATQSKVAELAATQLEKASDSLEMWAAIQSILIAAANVSKILWPPRKKSHDRGKQLRDLLGIEEDNPLSDRIIRNHFEHYDERIEAWFEDSSSAVYTDLEIDSLPKDPLSLPCRSHRRYNPLTRELTFRDESIDLAVVLATLQEIKAKCRHFVLV